MTAAAAEHANTVRICATRAACAQRIGQVPRSFRADEILAQDKRFQRRATAVTAATTASCVSSRSCSRARYVGRASGTAQRLGDQPNALIAQRVVAQIEKRETTRLLLNRATQPAPAVLRIFAPRLKRSCNATSGKKPLG